MKKPWYIAGIFVLAVLAAVWYFGARKTDLSPSPEPQQPPSQNISAQASRMTFFLTSVNPGKGADLGGLAGADSYCQTLAASAGAGNKTWRAYLSAQAVGNAQAVDARDRIGNGPWQNFQGTVIANNLEELHSNNKIAKATALTEKGGIVNGRGDTPNTHDILTGSGMDGRSIPGETDTTCGNWTKSGEGAAMLGHHDRVGTSDTDAARSWNSSHLSRGCGLEALASTGGGGLFYCFAVAE